jgi:L-lactate dehydrogenase complex protein LldE
MKVGLFVTCLVDLMRPRIGFSALALLEAAGCEVLVPRTQTCCGQPGYNSGDRTAAIALARKLVSEFAGCEYVVVPSGSCAGMIRTHYPELLSAIPEDEQATFLAVAARTYELTDFLVNICHWQMPEPASQPEQVNQQQANSQKKSYKSVTYHDSCAGLRELNVKTQPRQLLAQVPNVSLTEMAECEQCCGFGGTFALKFGEISAHIAERKCENITASGAAAVVLGDLGCMLSIEGRLRRRGDLNTEVLHIAELVAQALPNPPMQK